MMNRFRKTVASPTNLPAAFLTVAALSLQWAPAAAAQQSEEPEGGIAIEEILVTAQKRTQSIQEVPVSVTAFDGNTIEDNGAVNLEDLSGIAPNVQISQMAIIPNVGSFTIRGINFTDPDPNADPKTGVSLDGVPLTRNNGVLMDTFDIDQVEVLRGPQGTLYGRNNLAGSVTLVSARPTEEFGGKAKATFGNHGQQIFRGVLNSGAVGTDGRFRAKVALSTRSYDGHSENTVTGTQLGAQEADGGRATFAYEGDRFDLTLIGDYVSDEFTGPAASNQWNDPYGVGADGDEYKVNQDVDGFSDFETWGLTLEANRELEVGTLTLVTGHRELEYHTFGDFDGWAGRAGRPQGFPLPPFSAFHIRRVADHDQQSVELRFVDSHSDRLDYVVGFFFLQEEFTQTNYQNTGFPPLPIFFPLEDPSKAPVLLSIGQESRSMAFFGQTDINLTDQMALVLGGRFTLDAETARSFSLGAAFPVGPFDVTVDYFDIAVDGRIAISEQQDFRGLLVAAGLRQGLTLADLQITADANGDGAIDAGDGETSKILNALDAAGVLDAADFAGAEDLATFGFFGNDFDTRTRGADLVASAGFELFGGDGEFAIAANYTATDVVHPGGLGATRLRQLEEGLPKWKGNASWRHRWGQWRTLLRLNFHGPYGEAHLDNGSLWIDAEGERTLDAEVGYEVGRGWELVAGAVNLLNNFPVQHAYQRVAGSKYPTTAPFGLSGGEYYLKVRYLW